MNQTDRLERDLTAWFGETAAPSTPDYIDDILRETARTRQRPRWSFLERWIPMSETTLRRFAPSPVPWRTVAVLALLLALLVAAVALYTGSRPRLPEPFGPAANGLVAYAQDGDIWTVDPITGIRNSLVTGVELDADPRWSLDGTKVAFFRKLDNRSIPAFVTTADGRVVMGKTGPPGEVDSESISWSHDGRSLSFTALGSIYVADALTGDVRMLADVRLADGEVFWRPPEGRQLLLLGQASGVRRMMLVTVADGAIVELPVPDEVVQIDRASGWTPDGKRFLFMGASPGEDRPSTYVVDMESGEHGVLPLVYSQISNDGRRVVGLNGDDANNTWLCVAPIDGGDCVPITERFFGGWGTHHRWSPDDQWILARRGEDDALFVLDPDRLTAGQPAWIEQGGESWQRVAP